jgi:L-fuconolactonase
MHAVPRIDAHQHFWRFEPAEYEWIEDSMAALQRDFLPDDLRPLLDAAGLDGCVAVQTRQSLEETAFLLQLADTHPFIVGVVGWVDLQSADVERQLESAARHAKLVGIRHIVQAEPDGFMRGAAFRRGIAAMERAGLAYDILIYARQFPEAIELAAAFPGQRFVLDHLGKPDIRGHGFDAWRRHLDRIAALPNVWAKLSGLVTEAEWSRWTPETLEPYVAAALEAFGAKRLMIGSDWPVCTVAADYVTVMKIVRDVMDGRPAAERDAVLGGTACRFWNLRVPTPGVES